MNGRTNRLPLLLIYAGTLVYVTDGSLFQVLLPDIRTTFGLSLAAVGGLTSLYSLAQLVEPAVSYLGDRVRRRWLLTAEMLGLSIFTAVAGLSRPTGSIGLLCASRAGMGVTASMDATRLSLLTDYSPPKRRLLTFYAGQIPAVAGTLIGPALAGVLGARLGWESPFLLLSVPAAVMTAVIAIWLKEPRRGQFELGDRNVEAPPLRKSLALVWSRPTVRWYYVLIASTIVSTTAMGTYAPVLFRGTFHVSTSTLGLLVAAASAAQLVALATVGLVLRRATARGPRRVLRILAVVLCVAGLGIIALPLVPGLGLAAAAYIAVQGLTAAIAPGVLSVVANVLPPTVRTFGLGLTTLTFVLVGPILPLLGALGDHYGIRASLLGAAPVLLAGVVVLHAMANTVGNDVARVADV